MEKYPTGCVGTVFPIPQKSNMKFFAKPLCYLSLLCFLFLTACDSQSGTPITIDSFKDLLQEDLVERVVVLTDKAYVEIHIDADKLASSKFASKYMDEDLFVIMSIEQEYFLKAYDEFIEEHNLINAPSPWFETRPNFGDFMAGYGFLFILLILGLVLFIILPLKIVSQKRIIRDLEDRISSLEQKNK